jgi:hypothetical protein
MDPLLMWIKGPRRSCRGRPMWIARGANKGANRHELARLYWESVKVRDTDLDALMRPIPVLFGCCWRNLFFLVGARAPQSVPKVHGSG